MNQIVRSLVPNPALSFRVLPHHVATTNTQQLLKKAGAVEDGGSSF